MKHLLQNILVAFAVLIVVSPVIAHPGRTASDGCHYCRTNCAKSGVPKGVRHCHSGSMRHKLQVSPSASISKENEVRGYARAKDGDNLIINETDYRLVGIDAPESEQRCRVGERCEPCGQVAAGVLASLVEGSEIRCEWTKRGYYGRPLATCYRDDLNINAAMVSKGVALAYRNRGEYVRAQERAKQARNGLWAEGTEFVFPWDYRKEEIALCTP